LLDMVQPLETVINEFKPSMIYTHHGSDLNVDHRLTHQAVLTACRPQPNGLVTRILAFEVPSSTEWSSASIGAPFMPNWFVNISAVIDKKMAALASYGEELRPFPHARSVEGVQALAMLRGSSCGVEAAEAFMLVREIVR
jgi:LmbE family N-acetylglucosaminyl deacetylase